MFSTAGSVRRFFNVLLVALAVCLTPVHLRAESAAAALFRIFLTDGTTLVSYGEFARVAGRVVFSVPLGEGPEPRLQLLSIPDSTVNWQRTDQYAAAVRAKQYADTRGEQDFVALTGQVTAGLNAIALTNDARLRVAMAEEARRNLAAWPAAHHGYKAAEVAQLVGTLDDVVAEMRIASGGNQFDLSLVATEMPPAALPALMPALDVRGSLETAYRAALLASDPDEKVALLRTLTEQLAFAPSTATWAPALRASASAALTAELQVEQAYIDLARKALKQAGERAQKADVRGLQQVIAQVLSADDRLGRRRSGQMNGLLTTLDIRLDEARRLRLARDARAARIDQVWQYRLATRTPRRRIIGLRAWLEDIRDLSGPDRGALPKISALSTLALQEFASIHVPADLQAVHAMLLSAVHMGSQAASLRQTAITSNTLKLAWDASAAAAGALLLWQRAHDELAFMAGERDQPGSTEQAQKKPTEGSSPR